MSTYQLEYRIGAGGMGQVYRATRTLAEGVEETIACKVMTPRLTGEGKYRERFLREVAMTHRMDHKNVVHLIDCVADGNGVVHMIMELVEGVSLAEIVDAEELDGARLQFDMVRVIAADVLDGLHHVHSRAVIHRDISPENVLVCQSGTIKVSDFGVAKAFAPGCEQSGDIIGKLAYQAPELRPGSVVDERVDLFSFAAMMYELLTGNQPFGSTWPEIMMRRHEFAVVPLPDDIPEDLRMLVMGLLVEDPAEREPQTAWEARQLLCMPDERDAIAAELGAMSARLYQAKCERAERRQGARALVAEPIPEPIAESEPVVEALAETWPRDDEDADAPVTRSTGEPRHEHVEDRQDTDSTPTLVIRPRLALLSLAAIAGIVLLVSWYGGSQDPGERPAVRIDHESLLESTTVDGPEAIKQADDLATRIEDIQVPLNQNPDSKQSTVGPPRAPAVQLPRVQSSRGPDSEWLEGWGYLQ